MNTRILLPLSILILLLATACSAAPDLQATYDPADLRFDGQRAYDLENEFVTTFPNRVSGSEQTRQAAAWLEEQFSSFGLSCQTDEWSEINYSRSTIFRNVVCRLPGASPKEIVVAAHHDIASTTIEGADNDGAGIAILLHLAEILTSEGQPPYTLVFVASDGEEYGMLGSGRFIETHPDPRNILAAFTMDNLGKYYYDAMNMETIGQYRRFTPLWLALLTRESARAGARTEQGRSEDLWQVNLPSVIDQITGQAAPVSLMDQGPLVAAGVPALGLAGHKPNEFIEEHYAGWHTPEDTMERQSPNSLGQSGLVAEALIRQLLSMESFPREAGPYLYFDGSGQVLRGLPLWLFFIGFVSLFFLGTFLVGRAAFPQKLHLWRSALPHFLGLWLPLLASIVLLYVLVEIRLMDAFARYPATTKDPLLLNPRWPAVIIFLLGLALFLVVGRWAVRRFAGDLPTPSFSAVKSLALMVVGLGGVYVIVLNPFSLLFFLPLLFWFLIGGRHGFGKALDVVFLLLGGLVVYGLVYMFGFQTLRYDFTFLWYMLNMFSIRMLSFASAAMITAILAAGLSMVVAPPRKARVKQSIEASQESGTRLASQGGL